MNITVDKEIKTPYYWQITDQIKKMILLGELADGSILPSERELAKLLDVHRNTVIRAYYVLKDMDLIDSVQGVGYRVTFADNRDAVLQQQSSPRKKVNWSHMIKDDYQDMKETYDDIYARFSEGSSIALSTGIAPAVYIEENIGADIAAILNEKAGTLPAYLTPYQGDQGLRQQILAFLRTKGIRAGMSQVQVLSETNQALDFIVSALLSAGDYVIIEEPVSPDVYRVIQLAGCNCITVPIDHDGMICDNLEPLIETHNPKFIYVNASYHDPTGNILSMERRKKLMEISNKYRIPIIEEDAASELTFEDEHVSTIKSMDRSDNVIYIYSFSLTFVPGLSMAFVVANEKLIKSLSYLVSIRVMSLNWISQKLLAKNLTDGRYYEKLKEIRTVNKEKCDAMCGYLDNLFDIGVEYEKPRGGVYVWCQLPKGLNGMDVALEASKEGVSIVPGEVYYPMHNGGFDHVRLSYSYESLERVKEGMERFSKILRRMKAVL